MVKLMGHVAMGLLWAAPAWILWDGRVSLAFVGFVLTTAMLPDADLVLRDVLPGVHHHGVTHTFLFGLVAAVGAGLVATKLVQVATNRWWPDSLTEPAGTVYLFVTTGLLLGGSSHVFADMLSSPDIAQPVEPLWPLVTDPIAFDVVYYASAWWNVGLLAFALAVHLVLAYLDRFPLDHPYTARVE